MKNLILFFALILMGITNSFGQIQSASLTASGLTCSMCSKSIYKALSSLPSVQSVDVDIDKSVFNLVFKNGVKVQPDDIKNAVTDAGFAVASLTMTANFPPTDIANDKHIQFEGATYHLLHVATKSISGIITFTLLDKNYVPNVTFRRNKKYTQMKCYETGKAEACCHSGVAAGSRIYHITL
ncbi:MAG: heavy-metal-associated domain-containing protein [Phycisphaerales bacterium]|nr:heavy-metal-associated domain-containing protein [Phycisphaerales bacterium]